MIFDDKKEAILYIQRILDEDMPVPYYRLKVLLDKNAIEIGHIKLKEERGKAELSLLSIDDVSEEKQIDITLNSYSLINYLPLLYHDKNFLKRYLFGVQSSILEINAQIFNIDKVFKAERSAYIDWISSWFSITYGNLTNEEGKRKIVANAVVLYKSRGTKKYFIQLIKALINIDIIIDDNRYSLSNRGKSTQKQRAFTVLIEKRLSENKEEELRMYSIIQNIFEKEKPVNTVMDIIYNFDINTEAMTKQSVIIYERDDYDYE
jgi:phage tail-like protein